VDGKKDGDKLGLYRYVDEKINEQTHFKRADAKILEDSGIDILQIEKNAKDREFTFCGEREEVLRWEKSLVKDYFAKSLASLMKKNKKDEMKFDEPMIEGYVVLYRVSPKGGMQ
jgi:hypothetical protein